MDQDGTTRDEGDRRAKVPPAPKPTGAKAPGAKASRRRSRRPVCTICGCSPKRLYRIKVEVEGSWVGACAMCSGRLALEHPHYTYGGRFSARRRRAG